MSIAKLLEHTGKAYGRGGDSTLVHMSEGEVGALQTLARTQGKQLTKNPTTGLPEAFVLAGLLPAIAGAGATAAGLSPLLAAGVVGGGTALLTGSLEKGLTAGLGAYGGAGLGAGLSNVGSTAAATQQGAATLAGAGANAATNAALPNLTNVAAAPGLNTASMMGAESLAAPAMSAPMAQAAQAAQAPLLGGSMPQQMANVAERYPIQQPSFQDNFMGNVGDMGGGIQQLFSAPNQPMGLSGESALDRMGGIMGAGTNALMAASPMLYSSMDEFEDDQELDPDRGYIRPYTFHRNRIEGAAPGERKFDQYFEEHEPVRPEAYDGVKRFAEGGRAGIMTADDMWRRDIDNAIKHFNPGGGGGSGAHEGKQVIEFSRTPSSDASGRRYEQTYTTRDMTPEDIAMGRTAYEPGLEYDAGGDPVRRSPRMGLGSLGAMGIPDLAGLRGSSMYQNRSMYAQGGMLEGPGDGLSDSIPAVIDGVQPAALSTDEFVIPADVVSALGNGSSDAGAQELYAMMDRIRERAHGKKKQQKKVNAKTVLPK